MNALEIILLSIGILVAGAGLLALLRARHYTKSVSVRRFDDM